MPKVKKEKPDEKKYFWKGKRVSDKIYKVREKQKEIGKKLRDKYGIRNAAHNLNTRESSNSDVDLTDEGRRIVRLNTLGKKLFCKKCKSVLSLCDIIQEKKIGISSIFYITCRGCDQTNEVYSDKTHQVSKNKMHFDTNTKIVMGVLNAGMGHSHLNKILAALNIPQMNWKIYKSYETEVGKVIEDMTHQSCE
ncbi:hypothetical protein PV328_008451 [Microctonus aethiopoides]|uniref:Mutator-like transposase domain-containing protein n=1 Tax=Microctonus aethiopoides TaxID=144406 RepID=A0AA39KQX7_9HYME|nr:hypothetical protein PV328_008451 [Microctonus aethiopoides]